MFMHIGQFSVLTNQLYNTIYVLFLTISAVNYQLFWPASFTLNVQVIQQRKVNWVAPLIADLTRLSEKAGTWQQ